jgi:hypothetical protein
MKKKTITLKESELRGIISEAVKNIVNEMYNNKKKLFETASHDCTFDTTINYAIVDYTNPRLNEWLDENSLPQEEVDVQILYNCSPWDEKNYVYNYIDCSVDPNGNFKNIIPTQLYQAFIDDIATEIDANSNYYMEQIREEEAKLRSDLDNDGGFDY